MKSTSINSLDEAIMFVADIIRTNHYEINCTEDFFKVFDLKDFLNSVYYNWKSNSFNEPGMSQTEDPEYWEDWLSMLDDSDEQEMVKIIMTAKDIVYGK